MHTIWTKHLETDGEKKNLTDAILGAAIPFHRLNQLLNEKLAEIERSSENVKQYQNPNWAFETAHKNGMVSAYKAVIDLVTIKDQ